MSEDSFADRSLEGITEIEVLCITNNNDFKKSPELFSKQFRIAGSSIKTLFFRDLSQYARKNMRLKDVSYFASR